MFIGTPGGRKTSAKFHLLRELLMDLAESDPNVRASAAARLSDLLVLLGLDWEVVAYLVAYRGDDGAISSTNILRPSARSECRVVQGALE